METQVHKRMFVNDLYVTIIRRGFQGKVGMADKATNFFRKGMGVDPAELQLEAKRELRDTVGNFCKEMASYGARVLGCVMRQGVVCTEIGEFLAHVAQRRDAAVDGAPAHGASTNICRRSGSPSAKKRSNSAAPRKTKRALAACCRFANIPPIRAPGCWTVCCAFRTK